jgi:microcystin-dependent protein
LFGVISTTYGVGDGSTTFNLPDLKNRVPVGAGTGTKVATFASRASNVITVTGLSDASNNEFQTGQAVLYSAPSGAMTGLTDNTTYYVIRTGNLTFSLATSLANAQNGTVISLSSDGTGTQTFTKTFTARTLGHTGGEENHAMSSTELLAHTHTLANVLKTTPDNNAFPSGATPIGEETSATGSSGGNVAMNNLSPFAVVNYIIKT